MISNISEPGSSHSSAPQRSTASPKPTPKAKTKPPAKPTPVKELEPVPDGPVLPKQRRYLRIPEASRITGMSRAHFYALMDRGELRYVSLREPGKIKGVRLICMRSLEDFLERHSHGPAAPESTPNPDAATDDREALVD